MQYDNPAGRLLEILISVKQHPRTTEAREVWRKVFGLPGSEMGPALSAKLGKAMLLSQQALDLLAEEHPELVDPPPTWAQQVSSAFQTHNVHGAIESFANNISNDTIANVRTAAVLLQKGSTRKVLTLEELRVVRDDLDALLQEVLAGSQPPEIRLYICRSLRKIIAAIDEYQLTGAAPIFEGIEQAFGHAGVDPAYRSFLTDTELGARVLSALSAAGNLMTVAVGMPQLAHFATLLLKAPA